MFGFGVKIKTVSVDELADKLRHGKVVLIDVREPYEYAAGHVKGAENVPLGTLPSRLGDFDRQAEIYVICQAGHRSAAAVKLLVKAGFGNAYSVRQGTAGWHGPLERSR